jgi:hypothetical protein
MRYVGTDIFLLFSPNAETSLLLKTSFDGLLRMRIELQSLDWSITHVDAARSWQGF